MDNKEISSANSEIDSANSQIGFPNSRARALAEEIIEELRPYCERIEVAGSVRRGKAQVKDIEIVALPLITYETDLLGNPVEVNPLERYPWRSLGKVIKNGSRYKQLELYEAEIKLDLFIVLKPAQFGVIFTIRTGPAEFSQWCVTQRRKGGGLPSHCAVHEGGVYSGDDKKPIPMPEELDFLDFLGLGWVEPGERKKKW